MSDLISRQAVLEEIDRASRKYSASFFKGLSIAADIVAKQPSAERLKGKWKEYGEPDENGKFELWYCTCSLCGKVGLTDYKFCPNCGAKMEEVEE